MRMFPGRRRKRQNVLGSAWAVLGGSIAVDHPAPSLNNQRRTNWRATGMLPRLKKKSLPRQSRARSWSMKPPRLRMPRLRYRLRSRLKHPRLCYRHPPHQLALGSPRTRRMGTSHPLALPPRRHPSNQYSDNLKRHRSVPAQTLLPQRRQRRRATFSAHLLATRDSLLNILQRRLLAAFQYLMIL